MKNYLIFFIHIVKEVFIHSPRWYKLFNEVLDFRKMGILLRLNCLFCVCLGTENLLKQRGKSSNSLAIFVCQVLEGMGHAEFR